MKKKVISLIIIIIYFSMMLHLIYLSTYNNYTTNSTYSINAHKNYNDEIIIDINEINLKLPVKKAKDDFSNLDKSLVYYKEFNPLNKVIIFGHSGVGYGAFFNRVDELKIDDTAFIYIKDKCYFYSVYDIQIVDKSAIYLLEDEPNSKKLYLITCVKNDNSKRLVVLLNLKNIKTIEK